MQAQCFGGDIRVLTGADDLRPEHWDAFWDVLPGHRRAQMGFALPDAGVL